MDEASFPLLDFVDLLMPLLTPYEVAFYVYLYRRSALGEHGRLVRASVRGMAEIVTSAKTNSKRGAVSYGGAKDVLRSLESKGVVQKVGDVTRDGTLYRVLEPIDLPACRERARVLQSLTAQKEVNPEQELDFYNVPENRVKVYERDGYRCRYCGKQLTLETVTLDHIVPVSKGGGNDLQNLVTACLDCNSKKTGRLVGDFLASSRFKDPAV